MSQICNKCGEHVSKYVTNEHLFQLLCLKCAQGFEITGEQLENIYKELSIMNENLEQFIAMKKSTGVIDDGKEMV